MKKTILYGCMAVASLFAACSESGEHFTVKGEVAHATDSMLVFESLGLEGVTAIDSVRLTGSGTFAFKGRRPLTPEFYRLRIGGQVINLGIDSTETVTVKASLPGFASDYKTEGSSLCDTLRILTQMQMEFQKKITAIHRDRRLTVGEQARLTDLAVTDYKTRVKMEFIARDPASAASYFALFQSINGVMLFNPVDDAEDVKWFAAVATAWDLRYPGTQRAQNLQNIALHGQRNTRNPQQRQIEIDAEKITETGIIDISLPDLKGDTRRLSNLKGKVVLLDFTVFAAPYSQERILELRELYNSYAERGFEIYQVSLDADAHFWKTSCEQLPWVCVHDEESLNSAYAGMYHLQTLPTYFLIDRNCDLQARDVDIPDLKQAIEKLL